MKTPRASIGRVMLWIAAIGLNVGVFRAAFRANSEQAIMLMLIVVALEVAIWRAVGGDGKRRAFWLGFLVLGSILPATLGVLWCWLDLETGDRILHSWFLGAVVNYLEFTYDGLTRWAAPCLRPYRDRPWINGPVLAVISFLPLVLPAVAGAWRAGG